MAKLLTIEVKESFEELTKLQKRSGSAASPRIEMLLSILSGVQSTQELVKKTKSNRDSIRNWKNIYNEEGLSGLLSDKRQGGNRKARLNAEQKKQLLEKLSDPKQGFLSYKAATDWINDHLKVAMNYHAVNKYLKRNFKTKLKVGRKTHVNKEEGAEALFKKTI